MPAGGRGRPAIRFQGPPFLMEALVDFPVSPSASAQLGVAGIGGPAGAGVAPSGVPVAVVGVTLAAVGTGHGVAHLALPPSTPPGSYQASFSVEGVDYPAEVMVTPRAELRSVPATLEFDAAPGSEVPVELQVLNAGNVGLTLEADADFALSETTRLDRALQAAVSATGGRGDERLATFLDELAAAEAGPVHAQVTEGGGDLRPGEARGLAATFRFTPRLVPGRSYAGSWPIAGTSIRLRVRAVEGPPPKARRRASKEAS